MASRLHDDGNTSSIHTCKKCMCILKDAVKLACGHRVCGDECLKQLCSNPAVARCPVCTAVIIQAEVTADDILRNACFKSCSTKRPQTNVQNDGGIRNNVRSTELQTSSCCQEKGLWKDVKKIDSNCVRCIMTVARNGEDAICQRRRIDEELKKHTGAISNNSSQLHEIQKWKQSTQEYIRRQQKVVWPVHHPVEIQIGLLWKITDYQQKKERNDCETSDFFLSEQHGYTMCAQIYFNGNGCGKGSHISIFFALVRSEIDCILTWPFSRKVKLMILDQTGGGCHHADEFIPNSRCKDFEQPQQHMNKFVGISKFMTHLKFETPQYIKNNTLYLKVEVEHM